MPLNHRLFFQGHSSLQQRLRLLLTVGLLVTLSLLSMTSYAATTVNASVTKNKVTKDEVFQLRVVVNERVSSDELDLSILEKDFYLGRPSFGSSMNIVNGSRSVRSEWTVSIAPLRLGYLTIPSFKVAGASTVPITVQVSQDKAAPKQSDLAEFKLQLDKDELYPSQSTQLNVQLLIKADPRRLQNPKITPPSAEGVDVDPIGESKQYQAVHNGVEVTVVEQSFLITAFSPGQYQIKGPKLTGAVIYGDSLSNTTKLIQLDTPVQNFDIDVLAIPDSYQGTWVPTSKLTLSQTWTDGDGNKLSQFSKAQGEFDIKAGDSLTRTITMRAEGLTEQQLPNLSIEYPDSVRVYAEKPQFGKTESGQTIAIFKQVIIPKQTGTVTLPEVKQAWWNTKNKVQQVSKMTGLTMQVTASEQAAVQLSPEIPTQQKNTEIVTVKDAGYWPVITAVFAGLWAISSALVIVFWRKSKQHSIAIERPNQFGSLDATQALQEAIKLRDEIKIQSALKHWLTVNPHADKQLTQKALASVDELNRYLYSGQHAPTPSTWDLKDLTTLIKQTDPNSPNSADPLAHL